MAAAGAKRAGRRPSAKAAPSPSLPARAVNRAGAFGTEAVRSAPRSALALGKGRRPSSVAGFLGGMVLWAIVLQLLRNGPAGPAQWFAAKFWNDTSGGKVSQGGVGNSGVAGAGGAGASSVPQGPAGPGSAIGPGVLGGVGIGGPTQVYPGGARAGTRV
jgi:hypothetical protein